MEDEDYHEVEQGDEKNYLGDAVAPVDSRSDFSDNEFANYAGNAGAMVIDGADGLQSDGSGSKKRRLQVAKACLACASAHVKCEEARPCSYCVTRGIECVEKPRMKAKRSRTLLSRTQKDFVN